MRSIFYMMSLKLAYISFPSKIIVVNIWNGSICLVIGNMFNMCIESFGWNSISRSYLRLSKRTCWNFRINLCVRLSINLNIGIHLEIGGVRWFVRLFLITCHNLILSRNNSNFDGIWIGFNLNCFFHIVVSFLLAPETGQWMLSHGTWMTSLAWHVLDESNHSFITLGVKFDVITCFEG